MTDKCLETLKMLRENSEVFAGLSTEQLLFEAVYRTSTGDVEYVAKNTDWAKLVKRAKALEGVDPTEKINAEHYSLEVVPAVEPTIRHKIEDLLKEEGFYIIGGGQNVDGSGSDISFEKPATAEPFPEPEPAPAAGMSFGAALAALEAGYRVTREGWRGKGVWLELVKEYTLPEWRHGHLRNGLYPWIGLKMANDGVTPWPAPHTSLLAKDWVVVEEEK